MLKREVRSSDYEEVGKLLNVEPEALLAVIETELAGRSGFYSSGKPKILFEAHVMYSQLKKKGFNVSNLINKYPTILAVDWSHGRKLYTKGENELNRLELAKTVDEESAISSASWGVFQIMGYNYKNTGCSSVNELEERMSESEYSQFILGTNFIANNSKLLSALRNRNWAKFASIYNGPSYKENNYDVKMANAYSKYKSIRVKRIGTILRMDTTLPQAVDLFKGNNNKYYVLENGIYKELKDKDGDLYTTKSDWIYGKNTIKLK
jgi:hypothetical protein